MPGAACRTRWEETAFWLQPLSWHRPLTVCYTHHHLEVIVWLLLSGCLQRVGASPQLAYKVWERSICVFSLICVFPAVSFHLYRGPVCLVMALHEEQMKLWTSEPAEHVHCFHLMARGNQNYPETHLHVQTELHMLEGRGGKHAATAITFLRLECSPGKS